MNKKELLISKKLVALGDDFEKKIAKLKKRQQKVFSQLQKKIDQKKLSKTYKKIKTIKK